MIGDGLAWFVGPRFDEGARVGRVGKPLVHSDPLDSDGQHMPTPIGLFERLEDRGSRTHSGPGVAAAHLSALGDENHSEVTRSVEAVADEIPVALLEDMERKHHAGEQHVSEREHRKQHHHGVNSLGGAGTTAARGRRHRSRRDRRIHQ